MKENTSHTGALITKKDLTNAFFRWFMFAEVSLNFERLQALTYCYSLLPILQKLYPNKDDLSEAIQRHLAMYNTQASWGTIINGITIALEEQISKGETDAHSAKQLITSLKTGLMGSVAGIGDTLDFGTIRPIIIGLCVPFVMEGSVFAAIFPLVFFLIYQFVLSRSLLNLGYTRGKESIVTVLQSGTINKVINAAGMFGLLMMGALSASYVKIKTPLVISLQSGTTVVVQDMIDKLVPNLLPILVVFGMYFYISKNGPKYIRILVAVILVSLFFSFFGLL